MRNYLSIILLILLWVSSASQSYAARYSLVDIEALAPGYTITGINNVGTLVGVNADPIPQPFIWRIYTDPDTDIQSYRSDELKLLPVTDTVVDDLIFDEIHITSISNEQSPGIGADIIGWYKETGGGFQSVLWYQEENTSKEYEYKWAILNPLTEKARNCKADKKDNYFTPECIYAGLDDVLIDKMKQCATENAEWETVGGAVIPPCTTNPIIPICEFSMERIKVVSEPSSQNGIPSISYIAAYNVKKILDPTTLDDPSNFPDSCVLREHVEMALLANNCAANDPWEDNSAPDNLNPIQEIVLTCDTGTKAFGSNNNGTIFGVSYSALDTPHPVAWIRADSTTPTFNLINLGLERVDATPQSVIDYNAGLDDDGQQKSPSYRITRRSGEIQFASTATSDVAGILKPEETDTNSHPQKMTRANTYPFSRLRFLPLHHK